jgi:hypothetical protein
MNKIILALFLCFSAMVGCSQGDQRQNIVFFPEDSLDYQITLNARRLQLDFIVEGVFKKQRDTVYATWTLKKAEYEDGSDLGREMSHEYRRYINTRMYSVFNNRGKTLQNIGASDVVNTGLLVAELPSDGIKLDDTWEETKPSPGDIFFDSLLVKYTCTSITSEETTLKVVIDFFRGDASQSSEMNLSKRYNGYYFIDNKTGTVKHAELDISGFSGISSSSGKVEIKKLTR